ncbi:MAG: polymerase, sigma-24 subunit, subfamily [Deltaproteobacteria bacterium]|nr:polymerase, sigma-24 subunit, subfamily [Deltaproteobacteria bacterium]
MIAMILGSLLPLLGRAAPAEVADPSSELVKRARGGERRAFDELYKLHVVASHRLLTRLVGPVPERDDLIQQVFLEALALKPKKRIAYVLRVVEGMSFDEIGGLVGAKAPAVGQRVKHAQRELSAMVERDRQRTGREAS